MENRDFIDRQALLSHLYDVRALELTKYKLTTQINRNTNQINRLGYRTPFKKPGGWGKVILCFVLTFIVSAIIFAICGIFLLPYLTEEVVLSRFESYNGFYLWHNYEVLKGDVYTIPSQPEFNNYIILSFCISTFIAIIAAVIAVLMATHKISEYKKRKRTDDVRVESELRQRQALIGENDKCISELKELDTVLAQNYSINIIPSQFRNVEGICYLYDYLSTSRESLESALLNFNMNKLNINMQQMIEMQCDMLLQQYITNARLGEVKSQNSALLDKLSEVERNTQLAAKYAAMKEANTRTVAFFKTYDFLRQ